MKKQFFRLVLLLLSSAGLLSCGGVNDVKDSAPTQLPRAEQMRDAVPKQEPLSKYGNPASYEVFGKTYYTKTSNKGHVERGVASWYGNKFHGRRTSSGEAYDMYKMTAAHKSLPLPSYAEVTNLDNGRKVVVRINDRGPFHAGRIIDLSYSAATKLGITARGTGRVEVKAIDLSVDTAEPQNRQTVNPSPVGNPSDNNLTFLQVGAFSTLAKAQQIRDRIQQKVSEGVKINPLSRNGNDLYRVRVGPLSSSASGQQLTETLFRLGYNDTHIVTE